MAFYRVRIREQIETNVTVISDTQAQAEADALLAKISRPATVLKVVEIQALTTTVVNTNVIVDTDSSLTKKRAMVLANNFAEELNKFSEDQSVRITPAELISLQDALNNLTAVINTIKN